MGLSTKGPISKWEGSWADKMAQERGARDAAAGLPYSANPYDAKNQRLAWSIGHNGARATIYMLESNNGIR